MPVFIEVLAPEIFLVKDRVKVKLVTENQLELHLYTDLEHQSTKVYIFEVDANIEARSRANQSEPKMPLQYNYVRKGEQDVHFLTIGSLPESSIRSGDLAGIREFFKNVIDLDPMLRRLFSEQLSSFKEQKQTRPLSRLILRPPVQAGGYFITGVELLSVLKSDTNRMELF